MVFFADIHDIKTFLRYWALQIFTYNNLMCLVAAFETHVSSLVYHAASTVVYLPK